MASKRTPPPVSLVRKLVQHLHAYVPGEQPKVPGLIKLNTNENPYPPAPHVLRAVRAAVDQRLRLYPDPTASGLRTKLAALHRCTPDRIFVANGSDELLALATRAFVEPARVPSRKASASTVQYFVPSYSLYPVLGEIHGAHLRAVKLRPDFGLPTPSQLKRNGNWDFSAALTFVTTPNAPTGRGYTNAELAKLCAAQKGVVVLDEAYVDFAETNALALGLKHPNVLVARTFSKAYSLCFQRVGYCVGALDLIVALEKIKDSYNVNGLGQVAALATLDHLEYYRTCFQRIIATREWLAAELSKLGFLVFPSQTNFLLVEPPSQPAESWLNRLRDRKILVRWFRAPDVSRYLRITIGSEREARALVKACRALV